MKRYELINTEQNNTGRVLFRTFSLWQVTYIDKGRSFQ